MHPLLTKNLDPPLVKVGLRELANVPLFFWAFYSFTKKIEQIHSYWRLFLRKTINGMLIDEWWTSVLSPLVPGRRYKQRTREPRELHRELHCPSPLVFFVAFQDGGHDQCTSEFSLKNACSAGYIPARISSNFDSLSTPGSSLILRSFRWPWSSRVHCPIVTHSTLAGFSELAPHVPPTKVEYLHKAMDTRFERLCSRKQQISLPLRTLTAWSEKTFW